MCGLTVDDKYALHHEFSNVTTKEDIESVESIKKYAASHQDLFDISLMKNTTNIATGEMLENFKRSSDKRNQILHIIRFYGLCKEGACQN